MTGLWAVTGITLLQITYQEEAATVLDAHGRRLAAGAYTTGSSIPVPARPIDAGERSADRPVIGASGHRPLRGDLRTSGPRRPTTPPTHDQGRARRGAGPWAGTFHAPQMLAGATGLTLSAVWARRRDAAEDLARQHGAEATATFDQLLERCDAVVSQRPARRAGRAGADGRAGRAAPAFGEAARFARTVADAEAIAAAADAARGGHPADAHLPVHRTGARVPPRPGRRTRAVRAHGVDRRRGAARFAVRHPVAPGRRRGPARSRPARSRSRRGGRRDR